VQILKVHRAVFFPVGLNIIMQDEE
jgi:hypothetical protein